MSASAALLATVLAISPVNAAPPPTYFLGGTDPSGTGTVIEGDINWILNGYLSGAQNVPYPRSAQNIDGSVAAGADAVIDIVDAATGPVRIAGTSQGALVIAAAKRRLMARAEEDRPDADDIVFVTVGDPSSATGIGSRLAGLYIPILGVTLQPAPDTPYHTIVVTREYDGLADFPDRPWNIIATLNAFAGIVYVHPVSYGPEHDLASIPPEDITDTFNGVGGRTTTYFIQNDRLPLLQPLRDLGIDERFVAAIEQPLKHIVDAGYSRNDGAPAVPDTAPTQIENTEAVTQRTVATVDPQPDEPRATPGADGTNGDSTPATVKRSTIADDTDPTPRQRREVRAEGGSLGDEESTDAMSTRNAGTRQSESGESAGPADPGGGNTDQNDTDQNDTDQSDKAADNEGNEAA